MSTSMDASNGIKAMVTDENGEISCSVDETNRIRALLGLRPLNNEKGSNEREAVQNFHASREKERREKEAAELRDKLEKTREKRILSTKVSGNTLAETKGEEELLSAADWVKRSRKKEKETITEKDKAKLQTEIAMKRMEEEDAEIQRNGSKYNASHLKGLQVMHSAKDFDIGEEVILTLADSNILDKDEDGHVLGITGEADFLENVNMTDTDRRLDRERRAKRLKQPVYTAYDDAEFADGATPGTRPSILAQYDQDKKSAPKFSLGENGAAVSMQVDEDDSDLTKKRPIAQSLKVTAKDISDYYTKAEYTSFTKPKSGKEKKLRRVRKKEEDLDPLEGLEDSASATGGAVDRGSRKNVGETAASAAASLESKKRKGKKVALQNSHTSYEQAGQIAEEKSKKAFAPTAPTRTVTYAPEEDDDADMAQSLARARRLALSQQKQIRDEEAVDDDLAARRVRDLVAKTQENSTNGAVKTASSYKSVSAAFSATSASGLSASSVGASASRINEGEVELEEDSLDAEGRRPDGTLVFTHTTEFTSRLQARLTEKARSRAEAVVRAAAAAEQLQQLEIQMEDSGEMVEPVGSGKVYARAEGGVDGDGKDEWVNMDLDEEEESDEDDQMGFVHKQPLVATGMAATLALLKGTGELGKTEELAGRSKDARMVDPSSKVDGVKLEYRDEFGRKLTQKEAFRQICYRFHGYGPGKKAKEKRLKAMDDQSKALSSRGVVDSGTMRSLVRAQEATGKAHVTIQGGEKSAAGGITAAELLALRSKKVAKAPASGGSKSSGNKSSITK